MRSVDFTDNYVPMFQGKIRFTVRKVVLNHPLQIVAVEDIKCFVVCALMKSEEWRSNVVSIVGDKLRFGQANGASGANTEELREMSSALIGFGTYVKRSSGFLGTKGGRIHVPKTFLLTALLRVHALRLTTVFT
ncbi:uncharacterized protein M421DRAFT_93386 [Didymella exigua CBS 183.55]|uniref:Uncharacterized protein n=1 Tax=Didymella exigua CBS 183.55 TaxID=1150837 RepID=A0A6A5RJH3_9PLEO|nr:uncharacterized protein M421DRAFT_93386 [Didymella exigua CBS 183.55]KAF1927124.1 hypothetical protein M421DRAFT_93386 [Didymella exigua CBS 183.55]